MGLTVITLVTSLEGIDTDVVDTGPDTPEMTNNSFSPEVLTADVPLGKCP